MFNRLMLAKFLVLLRMTMTLAADGLATPTSSETSERLASWNKRWSEDKIGWHKEDVNHHLIQHGSEIIPNFDNKEETCVGEGVRVLVPLCGKTVDMAFLANQKGVSQVVGIDGVRKALEDFSAEQPTLEIKAVESKGDGFDRFEGKGITLLRGDYFQMEKASVEKFEAVWDRASIVAINPELREDYVRIMGTLVKPGGTLLVSTLERRAGDEGAKAAGPPFSVDEKEIRRLYEGLDWVHSVTKVAETDEMSERFKAAGLTEVYGLAFVIKAMD